MKEGLTYKKFGEVATFSRGLTFAKGDVADVSSKKVLRSNNIDLISHSLNFDDVTCLNEDFVIPDEKKLHKGDIFICMSNGSTQHLGKVAFVEDEIDYAFGGFMGAIHPIAKVVYPKYAFYSCLSTEYRRFLASILNGININNLKWSDLSKFSIPVPIIETQQHIVSELDLLQSIIDKQKAQLKELDNLAQAVFYDMFGEILNEVPKYTLKDVASYFIGLTYKPTEVSDDGTIVLRSSNIQENQLDFQDIVRVNTKVDKKKIVEEGDILMCSRNGSSRLVGKVARIKNLSEQMSFGAFMTIIKSQYNDYLFYFFLSQYFRSQLITSQTATINQITTKMLDDIKLNVPPLTLQQTFAEKIESIEKQKSAITKSIEETQKLFDYTMDKYFG